MIRKCPLCGQPLPQEMDENQLQRRLKNLSAPLLAHEADRLRHQMDEKYRLLLAKRQEASRRRAIRQANAEVRDQMAALKKESFLVRRELEQSACHHRKELQHVQENAEAKAQSRLQQQMRRIEIETKRREGMAARSAQRRYETRLLSLDAKRERERARYEADRARLQRQTEELSRRLEATRSQQLGDEAEVDLFARLRAEFPEDRIERVRKGAKGADIVQHVTVGKRELGTIVYESKNVANWQNAFVASAKRYQKQYDTPYVLVATRALPRRQRGLCVVRDIPVVEPKMAIALASIIREAILEIGQLRLSQEGRGGKAHRLFEYIISNQFRTRFQGIVDAVAELREQQEKERNWHENAWECRTDMHDRIQSCRREVATKIKALTSTALARPSLRMRRAIA